MEVNVSVEQFLAVKLNPARHVDFATSGDLFADGTNE